MLKSIKELFQNNISHQKPSEQDLKLAAATLMFELIRSDGHIDSTELTAMKSILQDEFGLNSNEVEQLLSLAETSAEDAISLQGFTRQICDNWNNDKRMKLLEYLWILAMADDQIDQHERHLVRKLAGLLYLNDKEIIIAKENAKNQLASN